MERPPIPNQGANASTLRDFLDHVTKPDTIHRVRRFSLWEKARLYYQSDQWLQRDLGTDATRSPFWKPLEVDPDEWMPMPVRNEMAGPIRHEVSRLVGTGHRPYIRIDRETPEANRAAALGKDVLQDKLDKLRWPEKEFEGTLHSVQYGTWVQKWGIEHDYTKPERKPVTTAMRCPVCQATLSSVILPKGTAVGPGVERREIPRSDPYEEPEVEIRATGCPRCQVAPVLETSIDEETGETLVGDTPGPPNPLEPYLPSEEEARESLDLYGRPLGQDLPCVDVFLRNVSVYDFFPENSGIDARLGEVLEVAECHVESLDWIRAHYKNGREVKPMDPQEIFRWHPLNCSEYEALDPNLFDHHSEVREWHKQPWLEEDPKTKTFALNRGRSIVMAGDTVLLDGDLMIESQINPGTYLPRVTYDWVAWEPRDRELFGISGSEWMFDDQDSINVRNSQVQYARHKFGNPNLLAPDGADLSFKGFADTGYSSDIWYYKSDPNNDKPERLSGEQLGPAWVQEENLDLDSIQRRMGTMEVEQGDAPKDVTAASALMFLGEKAAEGRKSRIMRYREFKRRMYKGILELIHEFYRDEHYYHVRDRNDRWAVRSFKGTDLLGQTNVQLEDESAYDLRMLRNEAIKEGLDRRIINADDFESKRRIARHLEIPMEINEDQNLQADAAEAESMAMLSDGEEPIIDQRLDYHLIHFQVHTLSLMNDRFRAMASACQWRRLKLALWDWEEQYEQIRATEMALKMNPPGDQPPQPEQSPSPEMDSPELKAMQDEVYSKQVDAWQRAKEAEAKIAAMPKAVELRLMNLWQGMLGQAGITVPPESQEQVSFLMRFEAHMQGHYLLAKQQAEAAQGGAQLPAAPGGDATATGMMPSPQAQPAQTVGV
jgi:hypothetical protein